MKLNQFKKIVKEHATMDVQKDVSFIDEVKHLSVTGHHRRKFFGSYRFILSSSLIFIMAIFISYNIYLYHQVKTILDLDFNASISLSINAYNRVIEVDSSDPEGEVFLDHFNYSSSQLDSVLSALFKYAKENDYLTDQSNVFIGTNSQSDTYASNVVDVFNQSAYKYQLNYTTVYSFSSASNVSNNVFTNLFMYVQSSSVEESHASPTYSNDLNRDDLDQYFDGLDVIPGFLNNYQDQWNQYSNLYQIVLLTIYKQNTDYQSETTFIRLFDMSFDEVYQIYASL